MRRILLVALATAAVAVAAACGSSKSDTATTPTPTPTNTATATPTITPSLTFTIDGTGFTPHNGDTASIRLLQGTTVLFCDSSAAISAGTFTIASGTAVLTSGQTYTAELFANVDGNTTYDTGDHTWPIASMTATTNVTLTFDHSTTQSAITWTNGSGCPGN